MVVVVVVFVMHDSVEFVGVFDVAVAVLVLFESLSVLQCFRKYGFF